MPAANELSHQTHQKVEQLPPLILDSDSQSVSDTEDQPLLFQAIGTLYGTPHQEEEGKFALTIAGKNYSLFFPGYRYKAWLKQYSNSPENPIYLRVYPKCLLIPRKDPIIRFQVAAWGEENQWEEAPGIFKFRGIWQFVPQLRTPVISIYRNSNAMDPQGKFKASHLPALMRRNDDPRPFKFNPKIPKEQLPKRWFIQAIFKFIPSRNCWGWVEDLELPTERIPRYRKPIKPSVEQPPSQENKKFFVKPQKPDKPSLMVDKKTVATASEIHTTPSMITTNQESSKSRVLTRAQMAEKLGISDSTLYKRISQAKQNSDPPMIELDEQKWYYIDNPTGKGKVFRREAEV
ncbi:MAG: helix-turn-helix transcriptional regulator [cyanobacterium endosymbiont of Rhopalodia musculus]|uniref:helix-turn-helix transcriptional regulator n=1 Tax=cyanobacterium endosymbiont of Epithemia clementina EcSB TaxID=3034674 RepID=UPI0024801855|nr:hypothetical protein [cyanobacterium endosymbiont of Epithemia clementina EcSB]WGT68189.1 hypothetical protein P3F56_03750 [cyanobacterium endosymbiont of Epithemia clementina EcSB]